MITIIEQIPSNGKSIVTLAANDGDTLPTEDIGNGSMAIVASNGGVIIKFFDEGNLEWNEFSGGGGSGGAGMLVIHGDNSTMALDKTWAEISAAEGAVILMDGGGSSMMRAYVTYTYSENAAYIVEAVGSDGEPAAIKFSADSEDGYPVIMGG